MWQAIAKYGPSLGKIGLGLYSGSQGARAVGAATNIQAGQAGENAQLARDLPYRLNPYRQQSAEQWSGNVRDVSDQSADYVTGTAGAATDYARETAAGAGAGVRDAAGRASSLLDPYGAAGTGASQSLLDLTSGLNAPQEKFQFSEDDPSYQWRKEQGEKAIERSAAARGMLRGGGTLTALSNYGQKAASQEYQAAFNRFQDQQKFGLDRTRLQADTLGGLANRGLLANTQQGKYQTEAEKYAGDWANEAAKYGGDWQTRAAESAGRFRTGGAEYQSNMMYGANERNLGDIYRGEYAGMDYMTERGKALAYGQIGQEAQQQAGLKQAFEGFNDLANTYLGKQQQGGGGVQGYDTGSGGISPAAEYYRSNPWSSPAPGPAPSVNRYGGDSYWDGYWNDRSR